MTRSSDAGAHRHAHGTPVQAAEQWQDRRDAMPDTMLSVVSVGWVLAADERDAAVLQSYERARQQVLGMLREHVPHVGWDMPFVKEPRHVPYGALDPVPLLELGVHEKLSRRWDYALVVVPNDLLPRDRIFTLGVPSSALEVAVMSSAHLGALPLVAERLAALALHLLGHLWGLEHAAHGPMAPPEDEEALHLVPFPEHQRAALVARLAEAADTRLEEQARRWGRLSFYWHTLLVAPRELAGDIWSYAPWQLPARMGRLTAAAAVSTVFFLLDGGAWQVGINQPLPMLGISAVVSVLGATMFLFWGQDLGALSRSGAWREQVIRTRIVVFVTLLVGLGVMWGMLFAVSLVAAWLVPPVVLADWTGTAQDGVARARHAAFVAALGVLASAVGGNLEDEATIKAELFYDEET